MHLARDPYWWAKAAQQKLMRATGGRLLGFESAKHGLVDTNDLIATGPPIDVVLDVGANTGQSAIRFRAAFPKARIISFEPIRDTFAQLLERTAGLDVECHRLALGSTVGSAPMYLTPFSLTNSLVEPSEEENLGTEQVDIETLDRFVADNDISRIDLLKIDAEGADLEVLQGAVETLASGRIRFVMLEVGFHPGDTRHPLFDDARAALVPAGYRVFGIYGQTLEWTGEPAMRFANAMFCLQT